MVYYRHEIEGIANTEKLPAWAKRKLAERETEQIKQKPKLPERKPSLLGRLDDAKAEAAMRNTVSKDKTQSKNRGNAEI